jgi:hypothetical protein
MATYQYNGDDVREFPTLVLTVKPGDTFDAPDGLIAPDVALASAPKKTTPTPTPSAAPDTTQGA